MSITTLQEKIRQKKTPIALGLMPEIEKISPAVRKQFTDMFGPGAMADAESLRYHGTQALDKAGDLLPAVVIHGPSYLRYGTMGADVLQNLITAAKNRGMYVILALDTAQPDCWWSYGADALTVNPYGGDIVAEVPEGKAVFAAVRTQGGDGVQTMRAGDRSLFVALGQRMARLGCGIAIGTGYSLDIRDVRDKCENVFLLLPDCDGENALCAFDDYGHGAMTADFDLQYSGDVEAAIKTMKGWISVL